MKWPPPVETQTLSSSLGFFHFVTSPFEHLSDHEAQLWFVVDNQDSVHKRIFADLPASAVALCLALTNSRSYQPVLSTREKRLTKPAHHSYRQRRAKSSVLDKTALYAI